MLNLSQSIHLRRLAMLIIAGVFVWLATLSLGAASKIPMSQDEQNYLFQARLFARGEWKEHVGPANPHLPGRWSVVQGEYRFSKYPPLTSLILVPGVWLGVPGITMPLLAALSLWLLWGIATRLCDEKTALLAVALTASSPWFFGYAISFYSQTLVLVLTTGAVASLLAHRTWLGSVMIGLIALARPLDAIAIGGVATGWLHFCRRTAWPVVAATLTGLGGLLLYNYLLAGQPTLILKTYYDGYFPAFAGSTFEEYLSGFKQYIGAYVYHLVHPSLAVLSDWFWRYTGYILPLCAVAGLAQPHLSATVRCLFASLFVGVNLAYGIHPTIGYPVYGARYQYPLIGLLGLAAAVGLMGLSRWKRLPPMAATAAIIGVLVWQGVLTSERQAEYLARYEAAETMFSDLAGQCKGDNIALLDDPSTKLYFGSFVSTGMLYRNTFRGGQHPDVEPLADQELYIVTDREDAAQVARLTAGSICRVRLDTDKIATIAARAKSTLLYTHFSTNRPHLR